MIQPEPNPTPLFRIYIRAFFASGLDSGDIFYLIKRWVGIVLKLYFLFSPPTDLNPTLIGLIALWPTNPTQTWLVNSTGFSFGWASNVSNSPWPKLTHGQPLFQSPNPIWLVKEIYLYNWLVRLESWRRELRTLWPPPASHCCQQNE